MPKISEAIWAAARARYEAGGEPVREIAEAHGVSHVSLWRRAKREGWARPHEAPRLPDAAADGRLLGRLFRAFERQVADLEQRFLASPGSIEERDARTLSVLAKTFETLAKLRDEREETFDGDGVDLGELRTRLAQRLAALGPYEVAGGGAVGEAGGLDEPGGDRGAQP